MKKLLSVIATLSLSSGPIIGFTNVVSCGYKYTKQDIKIDTNTLKILCGDQDYFKVYDYDKLNDATFTIENPAVCSIINDNGTIRVNALEEGSTNIIVSAKNSNADQKINITTTSILGSILPNADIILKLLNSILPSSDEITFVKNITNIISTTSPIISLIAPLISSIGEIDDSSLQYFVNAFDTSLYADMTNDQVLEASQIRISNAILTYLGKYDVDSSNQVDWKTKDSLNDNLEKSMNDLSSTISSLIDGTTKINKRGVLNTNSIYATTELIGSVITILDYISNVDISDDLITWDDVSIIRNKSFNSKDTDGNIEDSVDFKNLISNFTDMYKSENKVRNLIGLLFSTSSSIGDKNDPLIDLSNTTLTYATSGMTAILQAIVNGALTSSTVSNIIKNLLPSSVSSFAGTIINLMGPVLSNTVTQLSNVLFNGWDEDKTYLKIKIKILFTDIGVEGTIADLYSQFSSSIPDAYKSIVDSVINDPLGSITTLLASILPSIMNGVMNKSLNEVVSLISPKTNINWIVGKLGDAKLSELKDIFVGSISDEAKISLTGISDIFKGLANTTYNDGTESKQLNSSVLKYIFDNTSELSDSTSTLWKSLGLQSSSLDNETVLKGIYLLSKNNTSLEYFSNVISGLNTLYKKY